MEELGELALEILVKLVAYSNIDISLVEAYGGSLCADKKELDEFISKIQYIAPTTRVDKKVGVLALRILAKLLDYSDIDAQLVRAYGGALWEKEHLDALMDQVAKMGRTRLNEFRLG